MEEAGLPCAGAPSPDVEPECGSLVRLLVGLVGGRGALAAFCTGLGVAGCRFLGGEDLQAVSAQQLCLDQDALAANAPALWMMKPTADAG